MYNGHPNLDWPTVSHGGESCVTLCLPLQASSWTTGWSRSWWQDMQRTKPSTSTTLSAVWWSWSRCSVSELYRPTTNWSLCSMSFYCPADISLALMLYKHTSFHCITYACAYSVLFVLSFTGVFKELDKDGTGVAEMNITEVNNCLESATL